MDPLIGGRNAPWFLRLPLLPFEVAARVAQNGLSALPSAFAGGNRQAPRPEDQAQPFLLDLVDTLLDAGAFVTLLEGLRLADLTRTLQEPGPFTLLAPTDEAFAKLPADDLAALLADPEALAGVLRYHLLPGRWSAAEIAGFSRLETLEGGSVRVDATLGLRIDRAWVIQRDLEAANGLVQVIESVLSPAA